MKFTEPLLSPEEIAAIMSTFRDDEDEQEMLAENESSQTCDVNSNGAEIEE